jgi:hypothetical protein
MVQARWKRKQALTGKKEPFLIVPAGSGAQPGRLDMSRVSLPGKVGSHPFAVRRIRLVTAAPLPVQGLAVDGRPHDALGAAHGRSPSAALGRALGGSGRRLRQIRPSVPAPARSVQRKTTTDTTQRLPGDEVGWVPAVGRRGVGTESGRTRRRWRRAGPRSAAVTPVPPTRVVSQK